MTRAILAGPRHRLPQVIDVLHGMEILHIVDHHGQDDAFSIGKPLSQASELSDNLVKLRSITNILKVEAPQKGKEAVRLSDIRQKIVALELNITEEDAARKKAESLLGDLERRIEELTPFAGIGLPLETYRGYESLAVLVGRAPKALPDLSGEIPRSEAFQGPGAVALFVPKEGTESALAVLARFGFSQIDVPSGEGDPKALLDAAVADREKWRARLETIEGRLDKLREKYAGFVVAAQEALEVEVEKAEAPLRFAVSEHSFVIDGWVPASKGRDLEPRMSDLGVFVETVESRTLHKEEEPPVLLKNPKPAKPFEMLIHLYSTPSYRELDPTLFMLISFPLFFGFMIGDAGYGAVFLGIGLAAFVRLPRESAFRRLLLIIALGGFWGFLFGFLVFGEAFGMAFHHPPGAPAEELSWNQFGVHVPIGEPLIHKTLELGEMFYLSIVFAFLHLGTSYVIGFVNEVRHNKKHAAAKVGWFLCLFGIFTLLTRTLSWTHLGGWVWEVPLAWFPRDLEPLGLGGVLGVGIPIASFVLILCAVLGFAESPVALLEIGGLLANVLSYLRLAGIGIGKATIAATFNSLILHSLVIDKDIPLAIVGLVLLVLSQLLVFVLGGVSAGIQAVRLNYVESFTKFYKGNGTMFFPFGARKTQEA